MERLVERVYECNLAVEAHMICDLRARAGISARVDGEFLQGAAGEIALGNTVKVRVDPARAAEAREVIAEWERLQPPDPTAVARKAGSALKPLLWLIVGVVVGGGVMYVGLRTPTTEDSVDYDGDGHADIHYVYDGRAISRMDYDRDDDGRVDARWIFDANGAEKAYDADDDFDGRFEWRGEVEHGEVVRNVLDVDGDGRPEQVEHSKNGVIDTVEYFAQGRVVKRSRYRAGLPSSDEYDDDGDGTFERRVDLDAYGEPKL
jgi:hypothetical protein